MKLPMTHTMRRLYIFKNGGLLFKSVYFFKKHAKKYKRVIDFTYSLWYHNIIKQPTAAGIAVPYNSAAF